MEIIRSPRKKGKGQKRPAQTAAVHSILKREDEQNLHHRTPLEAAIIDTVSRYFSGNGAQKNPAREKKERLLVQTLQRYFQGAPRPSRSPDEYSL